MRPALSGVPERTLDRFLLAGVILGYVALAVGRLDVPIPEYDEAVYMRPVSVILRGWAGAGIPRWPLMVFPHVGCPMSYLAAPFVRLWGVNDWTMRLPPIAAALASVLILLYMASRIFPRAPLWAPAGVCLFHSSFLIGSRTGLLSDVAIHWLLLSLVLLCLWTWSRTGRPLPAFLAFFFTGFGIYAKIIFVWFAFPAALVVWMGSRRDVRASRAGLAGLCSLGLLSGVAPLVAYNMRTKGATADAVWSHLLVPRDPSAAPNTRVLQNLATRSEHVFELFAGDFLFRSGPWRILSGVSVMILFFAAFFLYREKNQRAALAAAGAFVLAYVAGSTLTISNRLPYHVFVLLPLMLVLAGAALAKLVPGRLPLLLACALAAIPQLRHFHDYLEDNAHAVDFRSAGALRALSDYLAASGIAQPVTLDWGISHPLFVVSGGKVDPEEGYNEPLSALRPGGTALCYVPGCARLLKEPSLVLGEIRRFPEAPGTPVYAAIRIRGVR
jgi:4-amino-4-deoxy-L-arabinose transferase-like glycosyltransferase